MRLHHSLVETGKVTMDLGFQSWGNRRKVNSGWHVEKSKITMTGDRTERKNTLLILKSLRFKKKIWRTQRCNDSKQRIRQYEEMTVTSPRRNFQEYLWWNQHHLKPWRTRKKVDFFLILNSGKIKKKIKKELPLLPPARSIIPLKPE